MPDPVREIVINTGPVIALVAALGDLAVLRDLAIRVIVPFEVTMELTANNATRFAAKEFKEADWLDKRPSPVAMAPLLEGILDQGEASVIQVALNEGISTVCIDEAAGRRVARMSGLRLTGSLGIMLRAKQQGLVIELRECIQRMQEKNIRLSPRLIDKVLRLAGEK